MWVADLPSNTDTQSRIHNTPPEVRRKNREMNREQRRKSMENEKLRELREARVQAYEARMALKKKMEGIGGRPVCSVLVNYFFRYRLRHSELHLSPLTRNSTTEILIRKNRLTNAQNTGTCYQENDFKQ